MSFESFLFNNQSPKLIEPIYHASKGGIKGNIQPISRAECDFGSGFYMGTNKKQPMMLVCNHQKPVIYKLSLDVSNLRTYEFCLDINWAMFIAYNRKRMEHLQHTSLYTNLKNLRESYDVFIGYIADDRMFYVLERFFNLEITDTALIKSLSAMELGKQYVTVNQKSCNNVKILDRYLLSKDEITELRAESEKQRKNGIQLANDICKQYRREGKYFDEIVK